MEKAKSRLSASEVTVISQRPVVVSLVQRYVRHLPTLFLSLPGLVALGWILTAVRPESIRNWPLTNAYGPLLLASWWCMFFISSFVLLKTRRGLIVTGWLIGLLSLRLQHLELPVIGLLLWTLAWFGPLLVWELLLRFWRHR